jgi:hypothetical protein
VKCGSDVPTVLVMPRSVGVNFGDDDFRRAE